jgi:exodeoxyribonuclease III
MKLISWNVNGIRACAKKGFIEWINEEKPDVLGLQETKAHEEQLDESITKIGNYSSDWFSAEKKGYSSVAIYSNIEPIKVVKGLGVPKFDNEGRVIRHDYKDFTFFTIYFPNGERNEERLQYKLDFYEACLKHFEDLRKEGKKLVICGDYNTAHFPIDLARPKENESTSGFLAIERAWLDRFVDAGYIDTFREFNKDGENYSWWSMRTRARERNVGWRIDYFFITEDLKDNLVNAFILPEVEGSDHCPVGIELKF